MMSLGEIRRQAGLWTTALLWLNLALVAARIIWGSEVNGMIVLAAGAMIALIGTAVWWIDRDGPTARFVSGLTQAAMVSLLVYAFSGSPLQIDMHMYFFAILAICSAWVDWRPIVSFCLFTAVHHLALYVVLPAAVFPGDADLGRVALHAGILLLETGDLIGLGLVIRRFADNEAAMARLLSEKDEAVKLAAAAEEARAHEEQTRALHEAEERQNLADLRHFLQAIGASLERLSHGDLTARITTPVASAFDDLKATYNASIAELEAAIGAVVTTAAGLRQGIASIRTTSDHLSARTETQASSLQETVTALAEVARSVNESAQETRRADEVAAKTKAVASQGVDVVGQAISAMAEIETSSGRIGTIIGTIEEIAFQTSLLALNAGVEAARAGDAGKGFAVVAQEVRALSQRSADAAKEIKSLVLSADMQVKLGVKHVEGTGTALNAILEEVAAMGHVIADISQRAGEQAVAIRQVSAAAQQLDEMAHENAKIVDGAAASAHSLEQQTAALSRHAERFTVSNPTVEGTPMATHARPSKGRSAPLGRRAA